MNIGTRNTLAALLGFAFVVALAGTVQGQADPRIGMWKINVAKSKYNTGTPPKSGTINYEAAGATLKTTVDSVAGDGKTYHWEQANPFDGKDAKVTGNSPYGDMVARKRLDAKTIETTYKQGGKVTVTSRNVISADGKTMTITQTGALTDGTKLDAVLVYEKQ